MRNFITTTDTRKATTQPTMSVISSALVNEKPNAIIFKSDTPTMTGTARKKVNSAAVTRDTPITRPPMIVEPLREVPGMIDRA